MDVVYQGRVIPREGFRAFVYGKEGVKALVNSYEQYEHFLACGYFSTKKEALQVSQSGNEGLVIKDDAPLKPRRRIKKDKAHDNGSSISNAIVPINQCE